MQLGRAVSSRELGKGLTVGPKPSVQGKSLSKRIPSMQSIIWCWVGGLWSGSLQQMHLVSLGDWETWRDITAAEGGAGSLLRKGDWNPSRAWCLTPGEGMSWVAGPCWEDKA